MILLNTYQTALRNAATWAKSDGVSLLCKSESDMFKPDAVSSKPVYLLASKGEKRCKGKKGCYGTIGSKLMGKF